MKTYLINVDISFDEVMRALLNVRVYVFMYVGHNCIYWTIP